MYFFFNLFQEIIKLFTQKRDITLFPPQQRHTVLSGDNQRRALFCDQIEEMKLIHSRELESNPQPLL